MGNSYEGSISRMLFMYCCEKLLPIFSHRKLAIVVFPGVLGNGICMNFGMYLSLSWFSAKHQVGSADVFTPVSPKQSTPPEKLCFSKSY